MHKKIKLLTIFLILSVLTLGHSIAQAEQIWDPIEPLNRKIFWFNNKAYKYLLRPLSIVYDHVVPRVAQPSVKNFFVNLKSPIYLTSDLLQFNFKQAADHSVRFIINTTVGIIGIFDVAADMGIEHKDQDFGMTLARTGINPGPYIVLPLLGASNARDTLGVVVDSFLDPVVYPSYLSSWDNTEQYAFSFGLKTLEYTDLTNRRRGDIDAAKKSALDFYLFTQAAYYQHRQGEISGETYIKTDPRADDLDREFDSLDD